jgi:hypothetical protein
MFIGFCLSFAIVLKMVDIVKDPDDKIGKEDILFVVTVALGLFASVL